MEGGGGQAPLAPGLADRALHHDAGGADGRTPDVTLAAGPDRGLGATPAFHRSCYHREMARPGVSLFEIREAAPAIRSFCLLIVVAASIVETVVAVAAKRLDSEPLLAVQVAFMYFIMSGISMTLVASAIAAERLVTRVVLAGASALPLWFVVYSLLQLSP